MGKTLGRIDKEIYIGERSQMIMECIWEAGDVLTIQEIIDRMKNKCGITFSKSTINTLVSALIRKKMVTITGKNRHAYLFSSLVS